MSYASQNAIARARAIGLDFSLSDWREVFLAITDTLSETTLAIHTSAEFVGTVRDGGERYRIVLFGGRQFDAIYDPAVARIMLVIRPREPDAQPAMSPKPTPPLRGKTAERILA
jgi:hypothetical protein